MMKADRREAQRRASRLKTLDNRRSVQLHAQLAERRRQSILARR